VACLNAQRVWIRQQGDALPNGGRLFQATELPQRLKTGSGEQSYDYAVLDLPEIVEKAGWSFMLRKPSGRKIGEPIALLGFPLEHDNLSCSDGVISSFYESGVARIIQIDASVNAGNSGGPLLDHHTGAVWGVVTRKATGLTRIFAELKIAVRSNLQFLQQAKTVVRVGGLDVVKGIRSSQTQMFHVLDEIERQANVGIGYAVSIEHIMEESCLKDAVADVEIKPLAS
jgi:Trypsin-like peptidase domain